MDNYFTYSIIIPHKNTITLLRRCIESIPKRNDIQIIVIDVNVSFSALTDIINDITFAASTLNYMSYAKRES